MKKRHRQHINPLKMTSLIPRAPLAIPSGPEVDIELGCADGRFIIELAKSNPDRLYIGLDIRPEFMAEGKKVVAELGLDNVIFEGCNFIVDLPHLFPDARISHFFINFPDPWFKRRQRNRRWLDTEALGHLIRALKPRGEIFYQSDVWPIALEALALLSTDERLYNVLGEWTFYRENPFEVSSTRDLSCQKEGLPIWRMLFALDDDAQPDGDEYD
jgi:tRNA (guanine-N7-)-methyltransferase